MALRRRAGGEQEVGNWNGGLFLKCIFGETALLPGRVIHGDLLKDIFVLFGDVGKMTVGE